MHYFGVPTLQKLFRNKLSFPLHQTQNEVQECFGAFLKPSTCKKIKTCVSGPKCTILGYRSGKNGFGTKASVLLHQTQNDVRQCLRALCKHSSFKKMQNFHFGTECTILGYRSCENSFATKASILIHQTQNEVWECLGELCKQSTRKRMQNLCFRHDCTISGYRRCKNYFATNYPFHSIRPKMRFRSVQEHFSNLRHVKR